MKIALICPSNLLFMPYVENYRKLLLGSIEFDLINWDRFGIESEKSPLIYRDKKVGHRRNFIDYYKFSIFVTNKLETVNYDKVIVFGIQLTFFLRKILQKKYKGKYVIDIRDHNKIINYFNFEKMLNDCVFTVISSEGYKEWLPKNLRYYINHNTQISNLSQIKKIDSHSSKHEEHLSIAYIGATRDYQANIDFICSLKNNSRITMNFHGEGELNKKIQNFVDSNLMDNVNITGRYEKNEEESLYQKTDLINVLRYNDGINNRTALPNRLYNAAINGKPMIAYSGSYMANQIKDYNLGLVVDSYEDLEMKILNYLSEFDINKYVNSRERFFTKVINENRMFEESLLKFIKS